MPFRLNTSPFSKMQSGSIRGSYGLVEVDYAPGIIDGVELTQYLITNYPYPNEVDQHSLTKNYGGEVFFRNITVHQGTGRSFASGGCVTGFTSCTSDHPTRIRIQNMAGSIDSWLQRNSNYGNTWLYLYGAYPTNAVDYWLNPVVGTGLGGQNLVVSHTPPQ